MSYNFFSTANFRHAIVSVMSTESTVKQETLGDFVRRVAREKDLSFSKIARRGGISPPSVSDIVSGKTQEIKSRTIAALAKGLGVPEREVYEVVSGKPKANADAPEFPELNDVPKEIQPLVIKQIRALIVASASEATVQSPKPPTKMPLIVRREIAPRAVSGKKRREGR